MPSLVTVALHTVIVYAFVILVLRAFGRRELGQLSPSDLLVVLLLGSAVETSMVLADTHLAVGIVAATTLLIMNFLITRAARRFRKFGLILGGSPVLLVHDGELIEANLRKLGLSHEDVVQALRGREQADLANIRFAVFEPNGEINVIPRNSAVHCSDLNAALAECE